MRSEGSLANLSERQLLHRFTDLVRQDQRHTARLLAAIAEIDERKLWAKHACPSMFAFCVERFHMSESMTAKRIWAARTARRFPVILEMVDRGELHLSAIMQLAKHLTEDNHRALLVRARHKGSREIDLLVAELAPRPDVPSRIRALPRPTGSMVCQQPSTTEACAGAGVAEDEREEPEPADACSSQGPVRAVSNRVAGASSAPNAPRPRGQVVALAPRRYKLEVTVDQQTHDKLRLLQDLLGHQLPSADPAIIVCRAIDRLLDDTLKKKAAITDQARPSHRRGDRRNDRRTRAIPAAIRREVWRRDGGRCTFVDQQGRRCRGTRAMEYHHDRPYGKGGQHETGNIALRCRAHNQYEADLDFGREFMRDKRRSSSPRSARNV
ncbi:MAG: hypothetical protein E4H03_09980 [Myxococcales bacterium]|nr:MAG: hypothetical protein E4H03_09980 [Myxococcales bacterium]